MATRRNEEEKIDAGNIEKVIKLLEPEEGKPITKKLACELLNIAYNTTRLASLIEKYKEKKEKDAARRLALRGKPASPDEVIFIISEYLDGSTIDALTNSTFRSANFIRQVLDANAVPIRSTGYTYFKPELIPDDAVRTEFKVGDVVYSARYDSIAVIEGIYKGAYRIWLKSEKWLQNAYQEACELASLEHLTALGVKL